MTKKIRAQQVFVTSLSDKLSNLST